MGIPGSADEPGSEAGEEVESGEAVPFADAREHCEALGQRVRLWLRRHRLDFPDRYGEARDEGYPDARAEVMAELARLEQRLRRREEANARWQTPLPLLHLQAELGLSAVEVELLAALMTIETEAELYRACARAWGDGRQGDVAFFGELVGGGSGQRYSAERALLPGGVLVSHGLVVVSADRSWLPRTPHLYCKVRLGGRVAEFLTGDFRPRPRTLPPGVALYGARKPLAELILSPGLAERAGRACGLNRADADKERDRDRDRQDPDAEGAARAVVALIGPRRSGRKALIAALLPHAPLVVVDAAKLPRNEEQSEAILRDALCEAVLQGSGLYVDNAESLRPPGELPPGQAAQPQGLSLAQIGVLVDGLRLRVFFAADEQVDVVRTALPAAEFVEVPMPDALQQSELWTHGLPLDLEFEQSFDLNRLTTNYSLPAGAICRCVEEVVTAARRTAAAGDAAPAITQASVREVVRRHLGNRFGDLAQLVSTTLTWDDLVLPRDVLDRVLEVVAYAKYRQRLLSEWGFERLLPYGNSISMLFAGAPGTGKTMVSSLVAKEIGLEVFRVNVSRVVDKYIGETEKNLARLFEEARRGQVALLFDEADSLFGKRTEIKSSTDRYSNLAINYLLQALESHDGVIILTTNHENAMDAAFKRRIRFRITFPLPDENERAQLWRSMLPVEAKVAPSIDWEALAHEFDLAGASIKNATVRAALRAIAIGSPITTDLLRFAARIECEEMGLLVVSRQVVERDRDSEDGEASKAPAPAPSPWQLQKGRS